jgi:hypothetical protein
MTNSTHFCSFRPREQCGQNVNSPAGRVEVIPSEKIVGDSMSWIMCHPKRASYSDLTIAVLGESADFDKVQYIVVLPLES